MKTALSYTFFAIIATLVNIGGQEASIRLYEGAFGVTLSILVGTLCGLVVKYILDKRYIFNYRANDLADDTHKFTLYTLMGIVTTLIFWGCESTFHIVFQSKEMRYIGGIIGLAIGYFIKYQLDKRFVFKVGTI